MGAQHCCVSWMTFILAGFITIHLVDENFGYDDVSDDEGYPVESWWEKPETESLTTTET